MKNDLLDRLSNNSTITLTPLRQEILSILVKNKKPMGAYEVLNKLRKTRPNAEPPTVYRVLDFFVEAKLVHRIEAQNTYVCCSHLSADQTLHKAILLLCKICEKTFEFEDKNIFDAIAKFTKKNTLSIDDALIEMKGICKNCVSKT